MRTIRRIIIWVVVVLLFGTLVFQLGKSVGVYKSLQGEVALTLVNFEKGNMDSFPDSMLELIFYAQE